MAPRRLLHVDGDAVFSARLKVVAEACGYEVRSLADSSGFREAYEGFRPDLIALEVAIPGRDGLELLDWLAQQGCSLPILVFTDQAELYQRAAELLAQRRHGLSLQALAKPLATRDLCTILNEQVAKAAQSTAARDKTPHSKGSGSKTPGSRAAAGPMPRSI